MTADEEGLIAMVAREENMSSEEMTVVIFDLGDRQFAIRIDYVREILEYREPVAVPDTPEWLAGILDIAGDVLPVVSLHSRFEAEETDAKRHLINLTTEEGDMIFTADDVTAIRALNGDWVRPVEGASGERGADFLEGAVVLDKDLVLVVDPRKVVDMGALRRVKAEAV